ncbi:hypothetical protein H310_15204 [Aphanomyces invadans]|uniref:DDE-1 domain-containing protein n=1 Tax=Aphanomyces invadans TaxID=157072 RepID=A0A024T7X2_9STRA|nr:hypothetical protein H310_15204 [Aphanomyces invadans]ETV89959.1 hypothetical protein H310_15204 [Aphanomyces invadans]|eukprot:XP_008881411.1 hypothetical protein H310_15204 [Aphanomyces invadans]
MSPHRSITRKWMPGSKKAKKRITMAFTTNAAGIHTTHHSFIGTAAKLNCFGGQTPAEIGFDYHGRQNGKTGTTSPMLVDSAPPHLAKYKQRQFQNALEQINEVVARR